MALYIKTLNIKYIICGKLRKSAQNFNSIKLVLNTKALCDN